MDRQTLGQKMMENLAIQGQIEEVKAQLSKSTGEKNDADALVAQGAEAKVQSDKLAATIKKVTADLNALEEELRKSDEELQRNKTTVPRLIKEDVQPTHMKI